MLLFVTLSNTQKAEENLRKMSVPGCQMKAAGVQGWRLHRGVQGPETGSRTKLTSLVGRTAQALHTSSSCTAPFASISSQLWDAFPFPQHSLFLSGSQQVL